MNEKLHYSFQKSLLLEHAQSQFNPAHNFTPYSTGISFNIILPPTSGLKYLLPFVVSTTGYIGLCNTKHHLRKNFFATL